MMRVTLRPWPLRGLLLAGLALLSACGPREPERDPTGDVVTFNCSEGDSFTVTFYAGSPKVLVAMGDQKIELTQVDSDLGIVFKNGATELSILRDYANLLGSPKGDLLECEDADKTFFG